jgi:hypothetical protein
MCAPSRRVLHLDGNRYHGQFHDHLSDHCSFDVVRLIAGLSYSSGLTSIADQTRALIEELERVVAELKQSVKDRR